MYQSPHREQSHASQAEQSIKYTQTKRRSLPFANVLMEALFRFPCKQQQQQQQIAHKGPALPKRAGKEKVTTSRENCLFGPREKNFQGEPPTAIKNCKNKHRKLISSHRFSVLYTKRCGSHRGNVVQTEIHHVPGVEKPAPSVCAGDAAGKAYKD